MAASIACMITAMSRSQRRWFQVHCDKVLVALWCVRNLAGCQALEAPEPVGAEPVPGFVVSTPVPVRALLDVEVVTFGVDGITSAFAVGTDGTILHFDGRTWLPEPSDVTVDLEGISGFVDDDGFEHVLACGANGTVLRRTGAGGGWELLPSGVSEHLFGVWVRSALDAFVVGDHGRVLRWDGSLLVSLVDEVLIETGATDADGAPIAFPISEPLKSVMGRAEDEVFAVGPRGTVYRYNGIRFLSEDSQTNRPLAAISTEGGVWAAATDGVLLRRRDGAWNDTEFVVPVPAFMQGVWARNDDDVYAVGLTSELFHLVGGAWTITPVGEAVELRAIDGAQLPLPPDTPEGAEVEPSREILAVGAGGRIVRGPQVLPRAGELVLSTQGAEESPR